MRKQLLILLLSLLGIVQIQAQTNGALSVSVSTSSAGGNYAPRNIVAIWIEDNSGKFVKTLLAYANTRKTHLNMWEASTTSIGSAFNSIDAITGATQSSHSTRTCTWNGTDYNKKLVSDGVYKVRMELTDKNSSGNAASFSFNKGPNTQKLTPANETSFSAISLNWTTTVTGVNPEIVVSNIIVVYPNPGSGQFTVVGENIKSIKITNLSGREICTSLTPVFDITNQPKGIYFVSVKTDQTTVVKKIIRN